MKRSIPIVGVALSALIALTWLPGTPAVAGTALAPLRATQEAPAEVQATLDAACATCHDLSAVQPGLYTMAEWQETINRMLGYGAVLTAEQNEQIVSYLGTDAPAAAEAAGGPDPAVAQALLDSRCATCHDLSAVQPGLYTAAEWTDTVNRMLGYGAALSQDEFDTIVQYLASDAGGEEAEEAEEAEDASGVDEEAAQALLNTTCTTCHDLSGIEPGVYTAADWTDTINRMLGYGVSLTEDEMNLLVNYLASDR